MRRTFAAVGWLAISVSSFIPSLPVQAQAEKNTAPKLGAQEKNTMPGAATVNAEHDQIGASEDKSSRTHTLHPDAQWYPDAGFGLFIHWGIASVKAMNISWPMIPGRALAKQRIDSPEERARIVQEHNYNLTGQPPAITPNQYWEMAKDFNPQNYNPDRWLKAAKDAGFTYVVLTTRHHEGFALWPSAYGDFNIKTYMGGRDLLQDYVAACRRNGLKVGFYYSPPDWHFDREYMDFLYHGVRKINPEFPRLDANLEVRTTQKTPAETAAHQAAYAAMVKGQIEELLTRYGKIDLLWFDGRPSIPNGDKVISQERIRQLQPGIVINPRLHGSGDFVTFERTLPATRPDVAWAEFCNTWTSSWSHQNIPFRSNAYVLGQLALCRSWGINYLLGVGPMANGEMSDGVYQNMAIVRDWMKTNGVAVQHTMPLPKGESASVPATVRGNVRYLFAIPKFQNNSAAVKDQLPPEDTTLTLQGAPQPRTVKLLGDGQTLPFSYRNGSLEIQLPAARRTRLVDVVQVDLSTAR